MPAKSFNQKKYKRNLLWEIENVNENFQLKKKKIAIVFITVCVNILVSWGKNGLKD